MKLFLKIIKSEIKIFSEDTIGSRTTHFVGFTVPKIGKQHIALDVKTEYAKQLIQKFPEYTTVCSDVTLHFENGMPEVKEFFNKINQ